MVHVVLALALVPGACAANSGGVVEPTGDVAGMKQAAWQVAACELQVIMQFVVVDVCADAAPAHPAVAAAASNTNHRMTAGLQLCGQDPSRPGL